MQGEKMKTMNSKKEIIKIDKREVEKLKGKVKSYEEIIKKGTPSKKKP